MSGVDQAPYNAKMLTKRQRLRKGLKRLRHWLGPAPAASVPVFICGEQRSGTNFLMDVLERCRETECFHENDEEAFDNYVLRDGPTLEHLVSQSRARIVAFKPICDSQHLSALLERFPQAKGLWAFRRYEDVVNSSLRNFTQHRDYLDLMLHRPEQAKWRVENVTDADMALVRRFYDKGVSDASARALIWYLRNSLFFQQGFDTDQRVQLTCYEDLVTDPRSSFAEVFAFLGMSENPDAGGIAFDSSLGKNAPPELDPEIADLCDALHARLLDIYSVQAQTA